MEKVEAFEGFLRDYLSRYAGIELPLLMEGMEYAMFGECKRLRPILVFGSYEAVSSDTTLSSLKKTFPYAAAVEMVHTYSLIHDDLPSMDDSPVRRGKPSVHVRFGEGVATLIGDGLLTEAFRVFGVDEIWGDVEAVTRLKLLSILASAAGFAGMIEGQVRDILYPGLKSPVEKIAEKKTAALITAACEGGGYLGGGERGAGEMRKFGFMIGKAFQIIDDIRDYLSGERREGEPSSVEEMGMEEARRKAEELLSRAESMLRGFRANHTLAELIRFLREV